jgi:hypothetical protein
MGACGVASRVAPLMGIIAGMKALEIFATGVTHQ